MFHRTHSKLFSAQTLAQSMFTAVSRKLDRDILHPMVKFGKLSGFVPDALFGCLTDGNSYCQTLMFYSNRIVFLHV